MDLKTLIEYCSSKQGAYKDFPFGPETLIMKISNKMFALIPLDNEIISINLKCDPFLAIILRERYPAVRSGYHMNKTHWNTVAIDGTIPDEEIKKMIDHSYSLVFKK